jgi:hypothetical protein
MVNGNEIILNGNDKTKIKPTYAIYCKTNFTVLYRLFVCLKNNILGNIGLIHT